MNPSPQSTPPSNASGAANRRPANDLDLMKYVAAFRDRVWLFLGIFAVAAGATFYFMMQEQPLYRANATLQILRQEESRTQFDKVSDETVRSTEDINTQVQLLNGWGVVEAVAARVEAEMLEPFLAPYRAIDQTNEDLSVLAILADNRKVAPARLSLIVSVEYTHPDPAVAAQVANLFCEEMALYFSNVRNDAVTRAVQDLREQAEIQRRKVENIEKQLVDFKEDLQTISFDQRLDIDRQEMVSLQNFATLKQEALDRLNTQWSILEEAQASGRDLHALPFIAESQRINTLLAALANYRIDVARLGERYLAKHPRMIEAQQTLRAAEQELALTVEEATRQLAGQRAQAEQDYQKATAAVDSKKEQLIALERHRAVYDSKARELAVNQNLYQYLYNRIQETEAQNRDDITRLRVVSPASMPVEPFTPRRMLAVAAGVFAGMAVAFGTVIVLILMDDRVKDHSDVENKLGLPIIGMLSLIKGAPQSIRELSVATANDPQNTETLNTIIAGLRLDPASASAKTILVTSTISNEGKSYVSAALASAFQQYGERVVLINCDLRAREDRLMLMAGQGLVPYLAENKHSLKDSIYRSQHLECDVMPAGGHFKKPHQLFSSPKFCEMLEALRKDYDRIIIDTPPVHLFGDALSLLPHCDGQIFVCGFARARLAMATKAVQKLRETGCPIFGAVINGVKGFQAKMYYPEHYQEPSSYSAYGRKKAAQY